MPAVHHVDPTLRDALTAELNCSSNAALGAHDELLTDYSDTGDAPTQLVLDSLVDHAAGALRGLATSLRSCAVEVAATGDADSEGDVASAPSGLGRDHCG
jgi:hypothetical protein